MPASLLNFEHTIVLNHLLPITLSKTALWQGLVDRVCAPEKFLPSVEASSIIQLSEHQYQRTLTFGYHQVTDVASLFPQSRIDVVSSDQAFPAFSSRTNIIGEGESLAVRFSYERVLGEEDDEQVVAHLKQAYRQMDEHALHLIAHQFKIAHQFIENEK